jgi:hypothetical protein
MTIRTDSKQGLPRPGLDAAREGRSLFGYVNDKSGLNSEGVLTDSTFLYEIPEGKRLVVQRFYMHVDTASDTATAVFGVTENADGSGTFTAKTVKYHVETGADWTGVEPTEVDLDPPIAVTRDDGHAFSAQVLTNDAGAELTLGYRGWLEDE